jgi:hypothetical protein
MTGTLGQNPDKEPPIGGNLTTMWSLQVTRTGMACVEYKLHML